MQKKIIEISNKYNLATIKENIEALDKNLDLKIGFLGEFSSGKSTLINALLDKKVLPSMDKPTSKSVIELISKDNLKELEFYELKDERKEKISATRFSEIALTSSDSKAMVYVPSNDFFQDGYMMIDTPGISSLDNSDIDITYGYLPFLDCAIICNHIQKGSLTQSIINFILKDEIRPIINNLLFVITNSYTKAPKSQIKIRKKIISQLSALNEKYSLGMNDIASKVVNVSALEAMEGKGGFTLDALKNSFNQNFIRKKVTLQEQKKAKEIDKITNQLLNTLLYKKKSSSLDLSTLKEKEETLNNEILALEQKRAKILKSLQTIDSKIGDRIYTIFNKNLPKIKTLKNEDEASIFMEQLQETIGREVSNIISLHFKELSSSSDNIIEFRELESIIYNLLEQINMGKDIGMVILIEILTLGTAGIGGFFGFFLRSASNMIMKQEGNSHLKNTAEFISKVNPLERVGGMISAKVIESQIMPKLEELSKEIAIDIKEELGVKVESEVFVPLEEKLYLNQKMLNQLYKEKSDKLEEFTIFNKEIDNDILELQSIKRVYDV